MKEKALCNTSLPPLKFSSVALSGDINHESRKDRIFGNRECLVDICTSVSFW